jgi:hypothetical protein
LLTAPSQRNLLSFRRSGFHLMRLLLQARLEGKDSIHAVAKSGDLELVQDYVLADPASAKELDKK